jgi:hypothetical protein
MPGTPNAVRGNIHLMRRVIKERIAKRGRGVDVALGLNADVALNLSRESRPDPPPDETHEANGDDGREDATRRDDRAATRGPK